jgi:serine/threonine protein kinase/Tol biopolymer transport system component
MSLNPGTRLGRYEIRSKIGEGGMGEVYLAFDAELERPVALKFLSADVAADGRRMQRFIQEARTVSALNHPNILTVYDIGQTEDGTRFFATEFINGETLRERMRQRPLKLGEVLDVTIQVAGALVAAHAAGIVHRDIKPENVMLRADGYVKVLDFGLAKLTGKPSSSIDTEAATQALVETDPGAVMGTVAYMSPEQARGEEVDARTDIWSLGVVLYEMLTGHLPFGGKSASHTIVAILDAEPQPLARFLPEASESLQEIVSDALTKDADARFQTTKQMLSKLRRLKGRLDAGAHLDTSVAPDLSSRSGEPATMTVNTSSAQPTLGAAQLTTARSADAAATVPSVSSAEFVTNQIKGHKKSVALLLSLAVVALAGLAFAAYEFAGRGQPSTSDGRTSPQAMKVMPLTDTGKARDAVVSPDGRYVAYVFDEGDKQSVHLRQVIEPSDREIVPPAPDQIYRNLIFSPDGNYVHYGGQTRGETVGDLYRVPVLGSAIRRLNHDVDSAVTFAPDGKQYAFVRDSSKTKESAIIVSDADGGNERQLVVHKLPEVFRSLAWSPDGQTIAYTLFGEDKDGYYTHVGEARVADGREALISDARWRFIGGLAWLPDKSGIIIAGRDRPSAPSTPPQIWQLAYPGGEARKLTNDLTDYESISLTGDAKTLVATKSEVLSNIWVAPGNDAAHARQITNGKENGDGGLVWTADGRIIYTSLSSGYTDIWITNADGSAPKQLTFGTDANDFPSVSPDGRYIVFETNRGIGWGIWRMNVDGSGLKELVRNIDQFSLPQVSSDSQWVFYSARDSSGKKVTWRVAIDGGTPEQLTQRDMMSSAMLSPDGKLLDYYYRENPDSPPKLEIAPTSGGEPVQTLDLPKDGYDARWSPDGRSLVYLKDANDSTNLWGLPLDGGKPRQLTDWQSDKIYWYAFSRDGKQLAAARGRISYDVVLIKDFK